MFSLCLLLCSCLSLLLFLSISVWLSFPRSVVLGSVPGSCRGRMWPFSCVASICEDQQRPADRSKPAYFLPFLLSSCLSSPHHLQAHAHTHHSPGGRTSPNKASHRPGKGQWQFGNLHMQDGVLGSWERNGYSTKGCNGLCLVRGGGFWRCLGVDGGT